MEEKSSILETFVSYLRQNIFIVVLIGAGFIFITFGIFSYIASNASSHIEFIPANVTSTSEVKAATSEKIQVDVEGEVLNPGVYTIESESRVQDALEAAGGLSSNADKEFVARKINLAQKISDGIKIYIPAVGEVKEEVELSQNIIEANAGIIVDESEPLGGGLVNINTATVSELETLPRVGPATSKKIIDGRPYNSNEDLVTKKVMGQKTFDGLKELITFQ